MVSGGFFMWIQQMDEAISRAMLSLHGCKFINEFLKYVTYLGEGGVVWILLAFVSLAVLLIKKKKLPVILVCLIVIGALGWVTNDYMIKPLVQRIRPYHNEEAFGTAFVQLMDSIHYKYPSGFSFPSGHSFMAFYAAMATTLYKKKAGFIVYPVSILIAFSRVFLGAHYFTDVFMGIVWGTLLAVLAYIIGTKIYANPKVNENKKMMR